MTFVDDRSISGDVMKKVGIINCTNTTQEMNCATSLCLNAVATNSGKFSANTDGTQLMGIINCAGCPTIVAPEKIFKKVEALKVLGVEDLHFSACVDTLCPFKNKYKKVIEDKFPELNVVIGTHAAPIPGLTEEQEKEMFKTSVAEILTQEKDDMTTMIKKVHEMIASN